MVIGLIHEKSIESEESLEIMLDSAYELGYSLIEE